MPAEPAQGGTVSDPSGGVTAQLFLLALATLSLGCRESSANQRTRAPAQRVVPETLAVRSADPDVRRAAGALRDGRPWLASQTLAPVLADSSRRTPEVELLAASAAAAWEGWSDVQALLTGRPWLDTLAGGRGRLLLARAAGRGGGAGARVGRGARRAGRRRARRADGAGGAGARPAGAARKRGRRIRARRRRAAAGGRLAAAARRRCDGRQRGAGAALRHRARADRARPRAVDRGVRARAQR